MSRRRRFKDASFPPEVDYPDAWPVSPTRTAQDRHEEGYAGTHAMVEHDPRDDRDRPIPLTQLFQ